MRLPHVDLLSPFSKTRDMMERPYATLIYKLMEDSVVNCSVENCSACILIARESDFYTMTRLRGISRRGAGHDIDRDAGSPSKNKEAISGYDSNVSAPVRLLIDDWECSRVADILATGN